MHRQLITRTQYLAELNRRLRDHPDYVDGMQFVSNGTADPETAAAYTQAGPLWQSYAGLVRYFAKKGEAATGQAGTV